jgi:O-antigen biosynthesis protein WbqP
MKRLFDLTLASLMIIIFMLPMLVISFVIYLTSKGPILYWSNRIGLHNVIYKMPKFRSMVIGTPPLATHLIPNPNQFLISIGGFLRRTSLDELPQLFSIFKGDMSFVGPRPALFNQDDLISLRSEKGVDKLVPGLTGWAQVNGRDELSIIEKVKLDVEYMNKQSFWFDLKILWLTFLKVINSRDISH